MIRHVQNDFRCESQMPFISLGHDFFGHHEQLSGEHPLVGCAEILCAAGLRTVNVSLDTLDPDSCQEDQSPSSTYLIM
jgi:hypothetical protein